MPPRLAGLHLGLQQAGYLLALSRALSSAHTTYALVLAAWLAGATAGLWLPLRPRLALALGLLAYLAAQATLASVDFLAVSPWCFAPAVAASGAWSGQFFAAAIAADARPGRTFAAETDGFLLGSLAAVLAYAWLGRHVLWAMPIGTALILLRRRP